MYRVQTKDAKDMAEWDVYLQEIKNMFSMLSDTVYVGEFNFIRIGTTIQIIRIALRRNDFE